ncbi:MAG TPA: glycerophosphodiester phosphodiesterase family protein, partial [Actinomycetes bacterium]|nr:glycerophosphodiester phosphodiesterase family protein [Actinomycetes bacterium]
MRTITRRPTALLLAAALLALGLTQVAGATAQPERVDKGGRKLPLVIGHRGASGYRPEHTLASYRLAIGMGADFIEPDLVSTKDHVLVARHENEISATTDVADHPEFADRRTTKTIDGVPLTGWFTEDFTLAELRTLRAKERIPDLRPDNTAFDGLYQVPTFQEVIDLAKRAGVGIYPETKHPSYFCSVGLPLEEPLVRALRGHGLDRPNAQVYVQSFEVANLRRLDTMLRVPLVQLVARTGTPYDLRAVGDPRTYAD